MHLVHFYFISSMICAETMCLSLWSYFCRKSFLFDPKTKTDNGRKLHIRPCACIEVVTFSTWRR